MRFCANLTYLFKELPFLERFDAAADAGFEAVEILFPYDDATTEIVRRLKRAGLSMVMMNTPPPNWTGGDRGFAAVPGLESRFKIDFRRSLRFAERLQPLHIHVIAGVTKDPGARQTFVDNLRLAADQVPKQSLTIEPFNSTDTPDYYLDDYDLAAEIIAEVDRPNLGLQFDLYHAHMITGDVLGCWDRHHAITRHVQIGGVPERTDPNNGTIDLGAFLDAVRGSDYDGWVSAEYKPSGRTEDTLGWMKL